MRGLRPTKYGTAVTTTFGRKRNAVRISNDVLLCSRCPSHVLGTISGTTTVTRSASSRARRPFTYSTSGRSIERYGDGVIVSSTPMSHSSQRRCRSPDDSGSTATYTARTSSEIVVAYTSAPAAGFVIPFTGTTTV